MSKYAKAFNANLKVSIYGIVSGSPFPMKVGGIQVHNTITYYIYLEDPCVSIEFPQNYSICCLYIYFRTFLIRFTKLKVGGVSFTGNAEYFI